MAINRFPTRYTSGEVRIKHKGVISNTNVGDSSYDNLVKDIETKFTYRTGFVPVGYEHRPDLISDLFYDTPSYWWLLMQVNGVSDPFESFNVGDQILIPEL